MCACAGMASHSSLKEATVFVTDHFETQPSVASCVKDLDKVRWWSAVWKRLAGQQEGRTSSVESWLWSLSGLSTHCQMADISLSVGVLGVTSCLSGCECVCGNICVWMTSSLKHRQVLSHLRPNPAERVHKHLNSLHSATWVCWFAVQSPPNMSTRTILCYCVWKELEQFRKQPRVCGLGTIGVECKWLWSLWQSTLFVNDWVEIWGEETGSGSCD